ncbi:hypothetical protein BKA65DRAFT_550969 [Rhexocercosporidium sp. MPI-PUGE-AT-0058]|nr:hypothetical protein BKA65DRAFT_550969 [Rhexocercosporidium sp. MPI-PUGE-AT-0058]
MAQPSPPTALSNRLQGAPPAANSPNGANPSIPHSTPRSSPGYNSPFIAANSATFNWLGAGTGSRSHRGPGPYLPAAVIADIQADELKRNSITSAPSQSFFTPGTNSSKNMPTVIIPGLGPPTGSGNPKEVPAHTLAISNQAFEIARHGNPDLEQSNGVSFSESTNATDVSSVPVAPVSDPPPRPIKSLKRRHRLGVQRPTAVTDSSADGNLEPSITTGLINLGTVSAMIQAPDAEESTYPHKAILPVKELTKASMSNSQVASQKFGPTCLGGGNGPNSNSHFQATVPTTPPSRSRQDDTMDFYGIPAEDPHPSIPNETPAVIPDTPPRVASSQIPGTAMSSDQAKQNDFLSRIAETNSQNQIPGPVAQHLIFTSHQPKQQDPPLAAAMDTKSEEMKTELSARNVFPSLAPPAAPSQFMSFTLPAESNLLPPGKGLFTITNPLPGPAPVFPSNFFLDPPPSQTPIPVPAASSLFLSTGTSQKPSNSTLSFGFGAPISFSMDKFTSTPKAQDATLSRKSRVGKNVLGLDSSQFSNNANAFPAGPFGIQGQNIPLFGNSFAASKPMAQSISLAHPISIQTNPSTPPIQTTSNDVDTSGSESRLMPYLSSPVQRPSQPDHHEDYMIDDFELEADPINVATMKGNRAKCGDTDMEDAPSEPVNFPQSSQTSPPAVDEKADQEMKDAPDEVLRPSEYDPPTLQQSFAGKYPSSTNFDMHDVQKEIMQSSGADLTSPQLPSAVGASSALHATMQDVLSEEIMQSSEVDLLIIQPSSAKILVASATAVQVESKADAAVPKEMDLIIPTDSPQTAVDAEETGNDNSTSAANFVLSDEPNHTILAEKSIVMPREELGKSSSNPDGAIPSTIHEISLPQEPTALTPWMIASPPMDTTATRKSPRVSACAHAALASTVPSITDLPLLGDDVSGTGLQKVTQGSSKRSEGRNPPASSGRAQILTMPAVVDSDTMAIRRRRNLLEPRWGSHTQDSARRIALSTELEKRCRTAIRKTNLCDFRDPFSYIERSAEVINEHKQEAKKEARRNANTIELFLSYETEDKKLREENKSLAQEIADLREVVENNRILVRNAKDMKPKLEATRKLLRETIDANTESRDRLLYQLREAQKPTDQLCADYDEQIKELRENLQREREKTREESRKTFEAEGMLQAARDVLAEERSDWEIKEIAWCRKERALKDCHKDAISTLKAEHLQEVGKWKMAHANRVEDLENLHANVNSLWSLEFTFDGMREAVVCLANGLSFFSQPGGRPTPEGRLILPAKRKNTNALRRIRNYKKKSRFITMKAYVQSLKLAPRSLSFRQYRAVFEGSAVAPSPAVTSAPERYAMSISAIRSKFKTPSRRYLTIFALLIIIITTCAGIFFLLPYLTAPGQDSVSLRNEKSLDHLKDTCSVIAPTITALACGTESPTPSITTHVAVETGILSNADNQTTSYSATSPTYIPFEGDDIWEDGPVNLGGIDWSTPISVGVFVTAVAVPLAAFVWAFRLY